MCQKRESKSHYKNIYWLVVKRYSNQFELQSKLDVQHTHRGDWKSCIRNDQCYSENCKLSVDMKCVSCFYSNSIDNTWLIVAFSELWSCKLYHEWLVKSSKWIDLQIRPFECHKRKFLAIHIQAILRAINWHLILTPFEIIHRMSMELIPWKSCFKTKKNQTNYLTLGLE